MNPVMGRALLTTFSIEQKQAMAIKAGKELDFQGTKYPATTDVFAMIGQKPQDERVAESHEETKQYTALGENAIVQQLHR